MTGVVFLDISKCFDTINHNRLLQKLYKYGVRNNELQWICSYLNNRRRRVFYNRKLSSVRTVIGVPQGSILGPILFLLYANDLPQHIADGRCSMYADDAVIYCNGDDV